jgi:hypothetical protein
MTPRVRLGVFVVLAAALGLAGCSEPGGPTAARVAEPTGTALLAEAGGGPDLSRLALYQQKPAITIAWARKWIGPEGGRLDFQGFAIEVPAGAVSRVTAFSIHLPVDPEGSERVVARFGPRGATFDRPVAIELPYRGTSLFGSEAAAVVWWDSSAERWVDMGGEATTDGVRLRTSTSHFSTYGTAEYRSDGITISGG